MRSGRTQNGGKGRMGKEQMTYSKLVNDSLGTLNLRAFEGEHGVASLLVRVVADEDGCQEK